MAKKKKTDATETPAPEDTAENQQPPLTINAQYTKDLSFEAPNSPAIFGELAKKQPDISINVDVDAKGHNETVFEVNLTMKAECKSEDKTAFILELVYGGLFTVNVPKEHLQPMLLIECPRLLFPFARNIVADITRDGGFPPLMLGPVDFVAMFQNQIKEQAAAATEDSQAEAKAE